MDILIISVLILLGLLFLVVEILILPGVTVAAILSVVCSAQAIYMAFSRLGSSAGIIVVAIIVVVEVVAIIFSLRAKTWARFSLKSKIESASSDAPQSQVAIGARGVAVSRLSPMGRVEIEGENYEAKSADAYIDERSEVEVVGFANSNIIVKKVN